jgi:hypothetical protein
VGDGVDLSGAADRFVGHKATLALHQVGSEDGVDEGGFAETSLSWRRLLLAFTCRL